MGCKSITRQDLSPWLELHQRAAQPPAWQEIRVINIGMMEEKMETTIILGLYGGNIGIMEKKMETTGIIGIL